MGLRSLLRPIVVALVWADGREKWGPRAEFWANQYRFI